MLERYLSKFQNKGWSKNSIFLQLKKENPDVADSILQEKASILYRELNRLNQESRRQDRAFYQRNILTPDIELGHQVRDFEVTDTNKSINRIAELR